MRLLQRLLYNIGLYYSIVRANILIRIELLKINISPAARHRNQHKENRKLKTGIARVIKALHEDYESYKIEGADLLSICKGYVKTPQEVAEELAIRQRLLNDYKQDSEYGMGKTFEKNFTSYKLANLKSKAYRASREKLEELKRAKASGAAAEVLEALNKEALELTLQAREYGKQLRELKSGNP
jgi:hypothetical protein